jgi:uncharacterized protein (TIGR02147 family)
MKDPPAARPDVARYTSYRAYLRDMIEHFRATRRWSFAVFAREAGFKSKSFLKLVADGNRNLSDASLAPMGKGLGLNASEQSVFEALVRLEQATADLERNAAWTELQRLTRRDPERRLEGREFEAYSRWYPIVIRELATAGELRDDPSWIGRRLRPKVRPESVTTALKMLESVGLLARTEAGELVATEATLTTGPEVQSLAIRNFHRAMLELAASALDDVPQGDRNVTALTLPLTRDQYDQVCELIGEFRRRILDLWSAAAPGARDQEREIYQLSLALFPVTQKVKDDG